MFQSILNKSSKNSGLIVTDNFVFSLDINTVEQHTSKLKVTENPIENGANIADHAVLEPKEISINGLIVGYEKNTFSIDHFLGIDLFNYPLPMPIKTFAAQAENMVNRFASHFQTSAERLNQVVADFLPEYQSPIINSLFSDRIADAYEKLLAIQRSGEPVILQTNAKQYNNMVLSSVGLTQQKNTYGEFSLTFREIFIVETQIASGLNQTVKKQNLGKTQPQKIEELKSVLYKIFSWFIK
ncbi:phage baseplate protein [Gilliamella sp. CG13]|uniref:phage baseplate protein n=1 Tax=unclassified Gilliamella TaxID=2685620 RepID=UPI003987A735